MDDPFYSTSCGGISFFTNNNPMVRNNVHLKFADGSEFSDLSEFGIPVLCKFLSGLPGVGSNDNDEIDDYEEDITLERLGGGNNWDYLDDDHKPENTGREVRMRKSFYFTNILRAAFPLNFYRQKV